MICIRAFHVNLGCFRRSRKLKMRYLELPSRTGRRCLRTSVVVLLRRTSGRARRSSIAGHRRTVGEGAVVERHKTVAGIREEEVGEEDGSRSRLESKIGFKRKS